MKITYGEMSEWLKEPVLKTGDVQASAGSNPALSSINILILCTAYIGCRLERPQS